MKSIFILGGYGATGRLLAKHLLAQTDARIVVGGRHVERARALVEQLGSPRLSAVQVDAADPKEMQEALQDVDMCIVAAPVTHRSEAVIRSCLEARVDYLDIQFSAAKIAALRAAEQEICAAGLCFVTEAGYHPGLPLAMVRYAASKLDVIESATTAGYLNIGPSMPYTDAVDELMEAFIDYNAQVFKDGAWTIPGKWETLRFDFGGAVGPRTCYSMFFEELRLLPVIYPSLKNTGFYISGSNWIADLLVTPVVMLGLKVAPQRGLRPLGKMMWWAMQRSRPPYLVMIAVEARGIRAGQPASVRASVSHPDGYELTAIPVVAFLKQYLDGSARRPGLHMMGHLPEPARLFQDMQVMGASVTAS